MRVSKWKYGILLLVSFAFLSGPPAPVLGAETGMIKGVLKTPWVKRSEGLVYIDRVEGKNFTPPAKPVFMGQKDMVFKPHVLPVLKGTKVDFTNNDAIVHNVFSPPGSAKKFNLGTYGVGVTKYETFNELGEVTLLCNVHPEMLGFIIILQNPYFDLTDKSGNFEIKDVPAGTYKLMAWHEKLQQVSLQVTVEPGKTVTVEFKDLKKR